MNLHNFVELCMCPAPLGNEYAAKQLIRSMLPNGLEISEDVAGSAIVRKPGEKPGLTFFASLSQPVVLVTGKKSDGAWELQPLGTGKTLEPMNGWKVMDSGGAQAKLEVKDGELRLTEDKGVQIGSLLTRQSDWTQDVLSVSCAGIEDRVGCWLLTELLREMPDVKAEITCIFLAQEQHCPKVAELAMNETDAAVAIRLASAKVNDINLTGAPVNAGGGPVLKLRERYVSTDGRLMDLERMACREAGVPFQYEVLELDATGLYTAQYGHCGVVVGGIDVPAEEGRILLTDLRNTRALVMQLAANADQIQQVLCSLPAVQHLVQATKGER